MLFTDWFYNDFVPHVTKYLKSKDLPIKAVLYVDNCSAHPDNLKKGEIECKFLPPNTTSLIQPMDQGPLRQMKTSYRRKLMQELVSDENRTIIQAWKDYNIRNAVINLSEAWNKDVKAENIQKSWLKLYKDNEVLDFEGFNTLTKASRNSEKHLKN